MENTFRIIYALCIIFLRFPSYYLTPVLPITYTDVIKNDISLCNNSIKQFLCQSKFTQDCAKLSYPQNIDKLTVENDNVETFLCLGMHDTIYKLCQYIKHETWNSTFSKQEDLDSSIQKLTEFKPNNEYSSQSLTLNQIFCNNLSGFTPMYEKIQPALLKLAKLLKDPYKCNQICFDLNDKLNPLCALLAWINQIDQTVKKHPLTTAISKPNSITNDGSNISKSTRQEENKMEQANTDNEHSGNVQNAVSSVGTKDSDIRKQDGQNNILNVNNLRSPIVPSNNDIKLVSKEKPTQNSVHNPIIKSDSTTKKSVLPTDVSNPIPASGKQHSQHHDINNNPDNAVIDAQPAQKAGKVDDTLQNDKKTTSTNKNVNSKATSPLVEDVKSTTLSENTQDSIAKDNTENNVNPDDFNRIDDDQLPNGLIDSSGQSIDIDNRIENIPETSGRREMDSFGIIKNDEESHFFTYFTIISLVFIAGYIGYHNKQKILAIVLEGRRSKNNRGRRRPSTANYRKLDCTLEEAVTSQCNANVTHVIY